MARSGAFDIRATEKGGNLCITLRRERHYQGQECGRIPRSPQRPLSIFPDVGVHNYASAVPPSVRIAETEDRSGKRERHRTFSAPGFSARFVLIPAPPRAVFVRFYGADGTLLGMDAGPEGYIGFHENATPVLGESVTAYTEPRIAPTPDQPDRIATLACIDVANSRGGGGQCEDNSIVLLSSCDGPGIAGGIVAADVVSVRLTLGTGAAFVIPRGRVARRVRRPPRDRRRGAARGGRARGGGARRRGPGHRAHRGRHPSRPVLRERRSGGRRVRWLHRADVATGGRGRGGFGRRTAAGRGRSGRPAVRRARRARGRILPVRTGRLRRADAARARWHRRRCAEPRCHSGDARA